MYFKDVDPILRSVPSPCVVPGSDSSEHIDALVNVAALYYESNNGARWGQHERAEYLKAFIHAASMSHAIVSQEPGCLRSTRPCLRCLDVCVFY